MIRYIIRRILSAIPVLLGITILDYAIMSLAGNPLSMIASAKVSSAAVEVKKAALGLNEPVYMQYIHWLKELLHGNMGYSLQSYEPVSKMIASHVFPTLLLMGSSFLIGFLIAIIFGVYAALHKNQKRDHAIIAVSFFGISMPNFFFALILIYIFTIRLKVLPSTGMSTLGGNKGVVDVMRHMIMPVLVLSFYVAGSNIRYVRSSVIEVMKKEYLLAAKAKGMGVRRILWVHTLKNASIPILTVLGMQIPVLFGGAVIIEEIFGWPGLGLITMNAILQRDYPVIMGICLMTAIVVLLANLVTDILYALVDPTIQYESRRNR